jgi:hypothetical protein
VSVQEGKKQLNVKVSDHVMGLVDKASYLLHRTKAQVIDEAVRDYATKHGIAERYQLNIKNGMLVLLKLEGDAVDIVEMEALNGVAPEVIAQRYSSRFHQDVPLVIDTKK